MKYPEKIPTCDHIRCEHPHRLEYCAVEGGDADGDSAITIAMITNLMYERGDFEQGMEYLNDGEIRYISRYFEYLHGDTESWAWPLLETRVSIVHERNVKLDGDTYKVNIGWKAHQQGISTDFYETFYTLELWPDVIYATVDEYNIKTEQLRTHEQPVHYSRPMTGYDHEVLFKALAELEDMRIAEERDNASAR